MSLVVPFTYLFFMTGNLTMIFKKKFDEMLPCTIMMSALVLYLSAFCQKLTFGFWLLFFAAFCFPVTIIIMMVKEKEKVTDYLERVFTPGCLIFMMVYTAIYVLNWKRGFSVWDEFSHWGPMIKETLRLDTFYNVSESTLLVHKDYPPMITLVEVLWCKLSDIFRGGV